MGTIANTYPAATAWAQAANANALANNAAKRLCGALDMTPANTVLDNVALTIKVPLGASGVSATGTIEIWAVASSDGTNYSDNIDTTVDTDQSANLKNSIMLVSLQANANSQVVIWTGNLVQGGIAQFSEVPPKWNIYIYNKSGAALAASSAAGGFVPVTNSY